MKVVAIKCEICGDIIYSRTTRDMRYCRCKSIAIDGGREYTRVLFKTKNSPKTFELEIDATEKQLYDDWNNEENKFGKISVDAYEMSSEGSLIEQFKQFAIEVPLDKPSWDRERELLLKKSFYKGKQI